jgi:zinc transporter ZupT
MGSALYFHGGRKGHERAATMGLMLGALVMIYLDVTLG